MMPSILADSMDVFPNAQQRKDFTELCNAFVLQTGFCWEMATGMLDYCGNGGICPASWPSNTSPGFEEIFIDIQ